MVLILCVTACASALLICCLIYWRSQNTERDPTETTDGENVSEVFYLQMYLIFCPNIIMFFAFVFWGVSEGSFNETVTCSALFLFRPLMLLASAPKASDFPGNVKYLVSYSFRLEYILFTSVVFSVLYKNVQSRLLHYSMVERGMITVLFGVMPFMCLIIIIYIFTAATQPLILNIIAFISFDILLPLQLILLFYAFGVARGTFLIAGVLPVIVIVARFNWNYICGKEGLNYRAGWACLIVFLQILWAFNNFRRSFNHWGVKSNVAVYVFGSVGVVLINAVALITELIMKKVNGEHSLGDLRITVFPSESFFAVCLLILQVYDMFPGHKPLRVIKEEFHRIAGFPNVVGCIDGTHIPIIAPAENETDFVNRKSFHSINVQIICDAAHVITNVEAKWPGSVHDSQIYCESTLSNRLQRGEIDGFLLGDRGYPCQPTLLTPYPEPEQGPQQRFNVAHSRTRARVEMTIGLLKARFQCLRHLRVTREGRRHHCGMCSSPQYCHN